jgi:hypothetical protein
MSSVVVLHLPCPVCGNCNHIGLTYFLTEPDGTNAADVDLTHWQLEDVPTEALASIEDFLPTPCLECSAELTLQVQLVVVATAVKEASPLRLVDNETDKSLN